jgi:hypothetical protein
MVRQSVKGVYLFENRMMRAVKTIQTTGLLLAAVALSGCKREQVTAYEIPKEEYRLTAPAVAAAPSRPQIQWTLPEGWTEKTGQAQMGVGAFRVQADSEKYADIRIIPLRAGPDTEKQSINIWREELGLGELPLDQINGEEFEIPGAHTHLYDIRSDEPRIAGKFKARTTGAVIEKDDTLWFVKMIGEESVVADQQDEFRQFLKSLKFEAGRSASSQAGHSGSSQAADWPTPSNWQPKAPPNSVVLAAYQVGESGKTADISVTSFPGDTGGLFANVNRWRAQMALPPIQESELGRFAREVTLPDGTKAIAVEITGGGKSNYTLVVRRGDRSWFYKIIGEPTIVSAEKERLAEFASKAK